VIETEDKDYFYNFFDLSTDYSKIYNQALSYGNKTLKDSANLGKGIRILKQDSFETLFSFIISQNNNIPRIRKIIKTLSAEYGVNISLQNEVKTCPLSSSSGTPCEEMCKKCGVCYTFPTADAVAREPERMAGANVGFRYKYLLDAARKVDSGEVSLKKIAEARSYEYRRTRLKEILGVGDKVAACCALFGFANYEAFPIDVWMKRAIDDYFDGHLDPSSLGRYAGVAQQYIFHYIRNLEKAEK
jgi:N-glycosylase/DNA lyase